MQDELKRVVRGVALLALATCLLAAAVFTWRDGSWTAGLLVGLTLAMSIVPEEFAVVWTVMLALGAWRLARDQVLTRQPQAIEVLGSITVLCVDKTGTLTRNRMEVAGMSDGHTEWLRHAGNAPAHSLQPLLRGAALASVAESLEPMDQAVLRLPGASPQAGGLTLLRREGVAPGRPYVMQCWKQSNAAAQITAVKGAPEVVLARCVGDAEQLQRLSQQAGRWMAQGLRVIAVAQRESAGNAGSELEGNVEGGGLRALGLVAFEDPLRDDVPAALAECRGAGVRVLMITGDAPATAAAIASKAGLQAAGGGRCPVLTGAQLAAMDDAQLDAAVRSTAVYARIEPAQKLRIVQALQRGGEVVAMTGDGVNDALALRAADVGVAMGERGTDVAREAAALVLLDDRFAALVGAVRAGRRIFINLQKAMGYLFAVHLPIVALSLLPLAGGPVLLLPIHVVLLELIIDPACSLVFEAEALDDGAMRQPPRPRDTPLFSLPAVWRAMAVGGVAVLAVAAGQALGRWAGWTDPDLRLMGLATLIAGNLAMLAWFRGGTGLPGPNRAFHGLVLATSLLCAAVLLTETLSVAFGFRALPAGGVLASLLPVVAWSAWRLRPMFRIASNTAPGGNRS